MLMLKAKANVKACAMRQNEESSRELEQHLGLPLLAVIIKTVTVAIVLLLR